MPEFRQRYLARATLLAHEAVNTYIGNYFRMKFPGQKTVDIEKADEKGFSWRPDEVAIETGNGTRQQKILIVEIPGLLRNTGQFAHVGLGRINKRPVIYVDSQFYYNEDALAHDRAEIAAWEARRRALHLTYGQMRKRIIKYIDTPDPVAGRSWRTIAEEIHTSAPSTERFYNEIRQNHKKYVDLDTVYNIFYLEYGLDEESGDVNVAAGADAAEGVIPLDEVGLNHPVGGKAKSFFWFRKLNLRYPPGVVVTVPVVRAILAGDKKALDAAVDSVCDYFKAMDETKAIKLAVRSSPGASMPGMLQTELDIPLGDRDALKEAIVKVARSWGRSEARAFRKAKGMTDEPDMGIIVQKIVGRKGARGQYAGVVFSRNPNTGGAGLYGKYIAEDDCTLMVSGERRGRDIKELEGDDRTLYNRQLKPALEALAKEIGCPQEVEFVTMDGEVYFLQTRNIVFPPINKLGEIEYDVYRNDPGTFVKLEQLQASVVKRRFYRFDRHERPLTPLFRSDDYTPGAMAGKIVFDVEEAVNLAQRGEGVILVKTPQSKSALEALCAIEEIGLITIGYGSDVCHEAVLARGEGIPCVSAPYGVSASGNELTYETSSGSRHLREGDRVVIDTGKVYGDIFTEDDGERNYLIPENFKPFGIDVRMARERFRDGFPPALRVYPELLRLNVERLLEIQEVMRRTLVDFKSLSRLNLEKHFLHELLLEEAERVGKADAVKEEYLRAVAQAKSAVRAPRPSATGASLQPMNEGVGSVDEAWKGSNPDSARLLEELRSERGKLRTIDAGAARELALLYERIVRSTSNARDLLEAWKIVTAYPVEKCTVENCAEGMWGDYQPSGGWGYTDFPKTQSVEFSARSIAVTQMLLNMIRETKSDFSDEEIAVALRRDFEASKLMTIVEYNPRRARVRFALVTDAGGKTRFVSVPGQGTIPVLDKFYYDHDDECIWEEHLMAYPVGVSLKDLCGDFTLSCSLDPRAYSSDRLPPRDATWYYHENKPRARPLPQRVITLERARESMAALVAAGVRGNIEAIPARDYATTRTVVNIEPPEDKGLFLRTKLGKDVLTDADWARYGPLLIQEMAQVVRLLSQSALPDDVTLFIPGEIRNSFGRYYGIDLSADMPIWKLWKEIRKSKKFSREPDDDGSPAAFLKTITKDPVLLAKALDKESGIKVSEVAQQRRYHPRTVYKEFAILKELKGLGIFAPVEGKKGRYRFSDMMIGPDENYTKTLIAAICNMRYPIGKRGEPRPLHRGSLVVKADISPGDAEDKTSMVKELIKMTILHQINLMQRPAILEGNILWHILEADVVSMSQRSSFAQQVNNAAEKSRAPERVYILKKGESIAEAMESIRRDHPNALFDVALSEEAHIKNVPGDDTKRLVFKGSAGDVAQLEGVVAALRALHGKQEDILPTLKRIYAVLKGEACPYDIQPNLIDDPVKFAGIFIFDLPPATPIPAEEIPKMNARLLQLLIAA